MRKYHKQAEGRRAGSWVICRAVKKCRLNGDHLTEPQLHQLKNRELVTEQLSNTSEVEEAFSLSEVREALEREYIPVSSYGYAKALENLEKDKAEAARLIAEGTPEQQEAFIQRRIWADEFTELLEKRDANLELLEQLKADREVLKKKWETDPDFMYEDVRQKELAMIDVNEEIMLLRRQINMYKDVNAPVVAALAEAEEERLKEAGEWREYEAETLNNLTKTAYYESGTREWLEQRQEGIGGSDVGSILGVKGAYNSRKDIMDSKLYPISDEQVAEQASNNEEYSGALGRGNAWEKRIFLKVRENNPEDNITFCKTSWRNNENQFQLANFDGLMADENGHPNGIVEIKTASDSSKWGPEEAGLDGVPPTYRAQALWYAQAAGFKKGMVAVVIDDREYRQYRFEMTPELEEECNRNLEAVKNFNAELEARKNGTWVDKTASRGFSLGALNSSLRNREKQEIFSEIAALRGTTPKKIEREFVSKFNKQKDLAQDRKFVEKSLRELYYDTAKMNNLPDYVGVDLETAGSRPYNGRIIEFGATLRSGYADENIGGTKEAEKARINQLYGLPRKTLLARGTGNSEVHGISETQISKKRQFSNITEGERARALIRRAGVMVAHNASFEKSWLNTHVPGFADDVKRGRIKIVDTMKISKRLFADTTPNDKLSSYTERFNVPYINSHRAYADAVMMCVAFENMWKELRKKATN